MKLGIVSGLVSATLVVACATSNSEGGAAGAAGMGGDAPGIGAGGVLAMGTGGTGPAGGRGGQPAHGGANSAGTAGSGNEAGCAYDYRVPDQGTGRQEDWVKRADVNDDDRIDEHDYLAVDARLGCPVGACDDGCDALDVNGDGLVTAGDNNLIAALSGTTLEGTYDPPVTFACEFDQDGDRAVTLDDFLIVVTNAGCDVDRGDPDCDRSDVDFDGDVDAVDQAIVNGQLDLVRCGGDPE